MGTEQRIGAHIRKTISDEIGGEAKQRHSYNINKSAWRKKSK